MTQKIRLLCVAAAALMATMPLKAAFGQQATPQLACGSRSEIIGILQKTYGEHRVAFGHAFTGAVAEIFAGPKGTWSIVATAPDGKSCLIGAGDTWTQTQPVGDEI